MPTVPDGKKNMCSAHFFQNVFEVKFLKTQACNPILRVKNEHANNEETFKTFKIDCFIYTSKYNIPQVVTVTNTTDTPYFVYQTEDN